MAINRCHVNVYLPTYRLDCDKRVTTLLQILVRLVATLSVNKLLLYKSNGNSELIIFGTDTS